MFSPKDYLRAVPQPLQKDISIGEVVKVVRLYFCPAMARIDKCSTNCHICDIHICKIMQEFQNFENKRIPFAVLRWLVMDYVSKLADATEVPTVVEHRDWLGQEIHENPFVRARAEL
jgi:hypothetical protein